MNLHGWRYKGEGLQTSRFCVVASSTTGTIGLQRDA